MGHRDRRPDTEIWTEVKVGDTWSRSQTRTTNATGFHAIPLPYGQHSPGTWTFRVAVRTGTGNVYSAPVTLTRTSASASPVIPSTLR